MKLQRKVTQISSIRIDLKDVVNLRPWSPKEVALKNLFSKSAEAEKNKYTWGLIEKRGFRGLQAGLKKGKL